MKKPPVARTRSYADDCPRDIDVVHELTNRTNKPIVINYNGRQIVLPREVGMYVCLRLLRIFRDNHPASALYWDDEDEARFMRREEVA